MEQRPPLPPFTAETALKKVKAAEDGWNSRDPERVSMAYTPDSEWRNRDEFFTGREAIREFLTQARVARGGAAFGLLVTAFVLWLLCLQRLDLSYAYPIACASVLLVSLFSMIFLGEAVTPRMWLGSLLILVGIALLTPSS